MSRIKIDQLSNEILQGIYDGLSNNHNSNPIYFDLMNLDVGSDVQGHFSSNIGNQEIANKNLMNDLLNGIDKDDIWDRSRYIPIERMSFKEFIDEFLLMANNKDCYVNFSNSFCNRLEDKLDSKIENIDATYDLQQEFGYALMTYYNTNKDLISDFPEIFNRTTTNLPISWVIKTFGIDEPIRMKRSGRTWNI